jgi:hypothetical protein
MPVVFVDEQVYRELPSFLVATVDKFAMVPWRAEAGMLFGRVHSRGGAAGSSARPTAACPSAARRCSLEGLRPPELIVQDELHLISGRSARWWALRDRHRGAVRDEDARRHGVRAAQDPGLDGDGAPRATSRSLALRARRVALFPPPGPDEGETFFARVDRAADGRALPGRRGGGRAMKAVLLRVYVALLCAAPGARSARRRGARPGRPVHDAGGLLQRAARARRHAPPGRGRGALALRRKHRRAPPEGEEGRRRVVSQRAGWASRSSSPRARAPSIAAPARG